MKERSTDSLMGKDIGKGKCKKKNKGGGGGGGG